GLAAVAGLRLELVDVELLAQDHRLDHLGRDRRALDVGTPDLGVAPGRAGDENLVERDGLARRGLPLAVQVDDDLVALDDPALAAGLLDDRVRAARGGGLGHGKAPSTRPARGGVPPRNARLPGPRWAATVGRPPARGGPPPRLSSGPMRSRSRFLNAVRSAPP